MLPDKGRSPYEGAMPPTKAVPPKKEAMPPTGPWIRDSLLKSRAWPAYLKRPSTTTPVVFCSEHRPGSLRLIFEVGARGYASGWDRMYRLNLLREFGVQAGHEVDTIREPVR